MSHQSCPAFHAWISSPLFNAHTWASPPPVPAIRTSAVPQVLSPIRLQLLVEASWNREGYNEGCLSYFCIAVVRHHDQRNLLEKAFHWGSPRQSVTVHDGQAKAWWREKLKARYLSHKMGGGAVNNASLLKPQSPPPHDILL